MPTISFVDSLSNPLPGSLQVNIYKASDNSLAVSGFLADAHNLIPDFGISLQTQWTITANGFTISASSGPNGISAFTYKGTGSASGFKWVACPIFNVIPGQTYTFGGYVDPSNITAGSFQIGIYDVNVVNSYATKFVSNGTANTYSSTWTCPDNVTQVRFLFDTNNCTVANGKTVLATQPFLQAQSGTLGVATTALASATNYYAKFTGNWGPGDSVATSTFLGNATSVTVPNYVSPSQTTLGYAKAILNLFPRGWLSESAKTTGGNAYNLALSLAQYFETIDQQNQAVHSAQRPSSALNGQLDSWVQDFLGTTLPRLSGEADNTYFARVQANLAARKGTIQGIGVVGNAFGPTATVEPWIVNQSGAYDTDGTVAYDQCGMYGDQNPLIEVFVSELNPVPNSDTFSGWTLANFALSNGGPNGASDLEYTGTGSAISSNVSSSSPFFSVVPGSTYVQSWWVDWSHVTSGSGPDIRIFDVAGNVIQDSPLGLTPGAVAGRYCGASFTLPTTNLVPFSDTFTNWALTGCALGTGGPNSAIDIEVTGTGSSQTFDAPCPGIPVTPGTQMSASFWYDATCTFTFTGEQPRVILYDLTHSNEFGDIYLVSGNKGRYSVTFTVPTGCTSLRLQPHCMGPGLTIPSGQKLKFSQPMLLVGSTAPTYYMSSTNPQVQLSPLLWTASNIVVANGQKVKFSQPMLRADGVTSPYLSSTVLTTQQSQIKNNILASRPGGVNTAVYLVDGSRNATQL